MRAPAKAERDFEAKAISGTHTILIALNCPESRRNGLMGFAFQREVVGPDSKGPKFLRSQKVFKSVVSDPKNEHDPNDPKKPRRYYTNEFPVQSFLWGDYAASPDTTYRFRILPMYGHPGALTCDPRDEIKFDIRTEKEWDDQTKHGVWFNRGAIASQKFAEKFGNKAPTNIDDPKDPEVVWLSRGLLEACLATIDGTPAGDGLRVAAYEFTYKPILEALKRAHDRKVNVQIVYHDTSDQGGQPNETAMQAAGLPINDQTFTYRRSKTKIPHNKFIVRLKNGTEPVEVWTGSTNFTASGFLGQTNVGHRIADKATAQQYLEYWEKLTTDPELSDAREETKRLTPDPPEVVAPQSITRLFSPRKEAAMLDWYGRRMRNAANSVWFTAAFGVTEKLVAPLADKRNQMRFVLMEKRATAATKKALTQDLTHVILSYGTPLGGIDKIKDGKADPSRPGRSSAFDEWFFKEEHFRPSNDGFVFFVHTKFLLIDPLSDDPLVISGSANFSPPSLTANDENQLIIRGDTRVADIYMTEFDRVFRHFYFRDVANELDRVDKSEDAKAIFLEESSAWTDPYFQAGKVKNNRRLMFFDTPTTTWFANAAIPPEKTTKSRKPSQPSKPKKPTSSTSSTSKTKGKPEKKTTVKKTTTKKTTAKKTTVKKTTAKNTTAKKTTAKKSSMTVSPKRKVAKSAVKRPAKQSGTNRNPAKKKRTTRR